MTTGPLVVLADECGVGGRFTATAAGLLAGRRGDALLLAVFGAALVTPNRAEAAALVEAQTLGGG